MLVQGNVLILNNCRSGPVELPSLPSWMRNRWTSFGRAIVFAIFLLFSTSCQATVYWCAGSGSQTASSMSEEGKASQCGHTGLSGEWVPSAVSCGGGWKNYGGVDEDDAGCVVTYSYTGTDPTMPKTILVQDVAVDRCASGYIWAADWCRVAIDHTQLSDDTCGVGNPIHPLSGIKTQTELLPITLGGTQLALQYDQRYFIGMQDYETNDQNSTDYQNRPYGSLGLIWELSVEKHLWFTEVANVPGAAKIDEGGSWTVFTQHSAQSNDFVSDRDPSDILTRLPGVGWRRINTSVGFEETYAFSGGQNGNLQTIQFNDGRSLNYLYSNGFLASVADRYGRTVTINRAPGSIVIQNIVDPLGQVTAFEYDGANLTKVKFADGNAKKFRYDPSASWQLTSIVDENHELSDGIDFATFAYDDHGRVTSTMHNGGVEHFSVAYVTPPVAAKSTVFDPDHNTAWLTYTFVPPVQATLTAPNGSQSAMDSVMTSRGLNQTTQSQPAGSGCTATTSQRTFDGAGNVSSSDDFNGNRTCYAYDTSRNLATVRLEGLPISKACPATLSSYAPSPADAAHPERKITTAWHPAWALKVQEAEPNKLTTWVYNGQPDPFAGGTANCASTAPALPDGQPLALLCSRYEQATTDTTGASGLSATVSGVRRQWSYVYNQFGQMLSTTTPKQSSTDPLSHTTQYAYYTDTSLSAGVGHTVGDLYTVKNPLVQMTSSTMYDANGQLLSSTDANSVVTTSAYWPRGWLKSQTVTPPAGQGSPQVTSYVYWPTGLIKTVTLPDTTTLSYAYDDAQRLTDITDGAGNRLHYVLDNVGNRTSEQVTDASGVLASTVSRVFDALNRVQSTTGVGH